MYFISKFIWIFLSPLNLIIIFLIFSAIFKFFNINIISRIFFLFTVVFFILVGFFPTGNLILHQLEKNYVVLNKIPNDLDGILILGGPTNVGISKAHDQVNFNDAAERLTESARIINNYNPDKVIFSGGTKKQNFESSHAYVAKKFFENLNIDTSKIIFEFQSRNTYENILNSKNIIKPGEDEKWLIITSAFHMRRAINISKKLEWNLIPYPVDFRTGRKFNSFKPNLKILQNFNSFDLASHETIGLISYYFLDRTNRIF